MLLPYIVQQKHTLITITSLSDNEKTAENRAMAFSRRFSYYFAQITPFPKIRLHKCFR